MENESGSLWPPVIKPGVMTPWRILDKTATDLTKQTDGVLVGSLSRMPADDDKKEMAFLDISVPELNNYRHRVLGVVYAKDMVYPALVDAELFRQGAGAIHALANVHETLTALFGGSPKPPNRADNDKELMELIGKVLQSSPVVPIAQSLIAMAEEAALKRESDMKALMVSAANASLERATQEENAKGQQSIPTGSDRQDRDLDNEATNT